MISPSTRIGCVAAALAVIVAAGCGSDDGAEPANALDAVTTTTTPLFIATDEGTPDSGLDAPTAPTDAPTSAPSPATTASPTAVDQAPTTVAPVQTTAAPTQQGTGAATDCLVGSWRLDDATYLRALVGAVDTVGQIEGVEPRGGSFTISFEPDGTVLGTRAAWRFGLDTIQGTLVTTVTSSDPGTYEATADSLVIAAGPAPTTVTMQLEEGGTVRDVPPEESLVIGADALSRSGTYTCAGDTLNTTIVSEQAGPVPATWSRVT
jgi:hypothetical protein